MRTAAPFPLSFQVSDYNGFGVSCNGASDGSVDLSINGGVAPYNILWSSGAFTEDISGVVAGTYVVTVIDAVQDTTIDSVEVTEPAAIDVTFTSVSDVTCNGFADGFIDLSPSGGTGTLSFLWSGGETLEDITGLGPGVYTVTVTDVNSCTGNDFTAIEEPDVIVSNLVTHDANGVPDGEAIVTPTGGTGSFSFLWSNGATTSTISGLLPGVYTVTITDANSCTLVETATINNALGLCTINQDSLFDVSCNGLNDGEIYITPIAAIPPITYQWSHGASTEDVTGLAPGPYTVTITDAALCTATQSFMISEPLLLEAQLTPVEETCASNNGSISSSVSGGTGAPSYLWSTAATTPGITGLTSGTYTLTVTDQNGCTDTESAVVNFVAPPQVVIDSTQNVSCFSGSNGAVYTTISDGTLPYTIQWSNSSTTEDITGLLPGTYTITVTDADLCTATASAVINQPAVLDDSIQVVPSTCGINNGSITVFPFGGTPAYSYLWNTGQTTALISGLAPGTYTVTVTDANLCTVQESAVVADLDGPVATLDSVSNVACFGTATGDVYISYTGGTPPVTFLWTGGATTEDLTNVVAGTYTVTLTDANSCTSVASGTVNQPAAALNDSIQSSDPTCGASNGTITVFPFGGTLPYTFLWNTGQTTATISSLGAGSYTVTITDANLCSEQSTEVITNISGPNVILDSLRHVSCFGGITGGVFITASGGTAPLTYLWSNSAVTQDIQNVANGTYTVTVTDANLCTATVSGTVTQPSAALTDSVQVTDATCGVSNGSVTVFPYGGTPAYSLLWNTGQTTATISGLAPGSYTVTITDANLCTKLRTANVNNDGAPVIIVDSIRPVRCFNGNNGGIFIHINNGTSPFSYLWSNGDVTQDIVGLVAGSYTVTVTDANLCVATSVIVVTQPAAQLNGSFSITNESCGNSNGSVTITPTGGTSPYALLWNTGQTTSTISSLAAGSYTVTITDANACTRLRIAVVTNSVVPVATIDSVHNVSCFGGTDGAVYVSVTGGTAPLTYAWSNGAITQDLLNVPIGNYSLIVTDALGCTDTVDTAITQPPVLSVSNSVTNAPCGQAAGSITANPSGGVSPYSYSWSNGGLTQTISNLLAGPYTVTVTDDNGCTAVQNSVVGTIAGSVLSVDSIIDIDCFGDSTGSIYIHRTGGSSPYSFIWSNGNNTEDLINAPAGTYTVTITDGNGCTFSVTDSIQQSTAISDSLQIIDDPCASANGSATVFPYGGNGPYTLLWSTGSVLPAIVNQLAGTYTITITDALGCTHQDFAVINNIANPVITIDSIVNVNCFGDSTGGIYISVSAGTLPYSFQWSNGSLSQNLVNVPAGTYTVTVTDDNGCTATDSGTVSQLPLLEIDLTVSNDTCNLAIGSITTNTTGGQGPYDYLWNNFQVTPDITGLSAGTYTVTVTDVNGCTATGTDSVLNIGGPQAAVDSVIHVNCNGDSTGAVYISVTGGAGTISYAWSNGSAAQNLINVPAGTYTVTVTDSSLCTFTLTETINQPPAIDDSSQVIGEACGQLNGSIDLFPFGGTPPLTFLWSTGSGSEDISGLAAGPYTVTITDSLGCQFIDTIVVPAVAGPEIIPDSISHVTCNGFTNGAVYISISNGTPGFTFAWSNFAVTEDITGLQAGNYSVIVTDTLSCSDTAFFVVNQPSLLQDSMVVDVPATCGMQNGSATVYPYGGILPYSFNWSNGQQTQTAINLGTGTIVVTVTDSNFCAVVDSIFVPDLPAQTITIDSIKNVSCNGFANGAIFITLSGNAATNSYLWSNADTTEDISGLDTGVYVVTVTDLGGCTVTQSFTITEPPLLDDSTEALNSTCGQANGVATIYAFGGTPPYSYFWSTGQGGPSISNLSSGTYIVTVNDSLGCTVIDSIIINDIGGPSIDIDSIIDASCFGYNDGAIYITATGGSLPYLFAWSNLSGSEDITGLVAGAYTVTVTDGSNCQQTASYTVSQPDSIEIPGTITPTTCGNSNGAISVTPAGGTPPYSYLWSTGGLGFEITGLIAGTYTVTVTDSVSCSNIAQFTVNNLNGPQAVVDSVVNVSCNGDSSGAIYVTVTDGVGPYSFVWSNFVIDEDLVNMPAGTYTLTVLDSNNCPAILTDSIAEPPPIQVIFTVTPASCNSSNGAVYANISGGVSPYDLLWNTNAVVDSITGLIAGIYTLTVTDDNGCTSEFSTPVNNFSAPVITVVDSGNVSCFGLSDGFITVSVTGGALPYTYDWQNTSQTGDTLTNLSANIPYTLIITDSLGCVASQSITLSQPDQLSINSFVPTLNDTFNLSCFGSNDGSISIIVNGGVEPYNYIWSNFANSDSIGGLAAGNYAVTITDANNCTVSQSYVLTQPPLLISNAGPNKVICGLNFDTLNAVPPVIGTGSWVVISGTGNFVNPLLPNTVVTNLSNGVNVFQWVVTDGICSAFSQVVITYNTQISAIAGADKEVCADSVLLTATSPQFGFGYWQVIHSTGVIQDTASAVTLVTGLNPGENIFRWFVVNGTCSDSADIIIFVNDPSDCNQPLELPTGFTPNGDNRNDFFLVKGLDDYPDNILTVFNRWGNVVYEKSGYLNEWNGNNNDGEPLVEGTYFVVFKVRTINKIITSYVDLRR